jgi:hypothetical protein
MKHVLLATLLAAGLASVHAVETPFTPFKDGHADLSGVSGVARTLLVRAGDSKAWVIHAIADGATDNLAKARLLVYVKSVSKDGTLRAYLSKPITTLEANTPLHQLAASADDPVGTAAIKSADHTQAMVSIPLNAAFITAIKTGNYNGIILEGADGLDAEFGSIEGGHGALLYLDYKAVSEISLSAGLVDSVALLLVTTYKDSLLTQAGLKGDKGDKGDAGPVGPRGLQGPPGIGGNDTAAFQLLQDRGYRARYPFDVVTSTNPRITYDSSGFGSNLTLSQDGVQKLPDAALDFNGSGIVTAPNAVSLNPYREITLMARVRLSPDATPDTQVIISKPGQYELVIVDKNKLKARFKTVLADSGWVGEGLVPAGAWHAVSASYDGQAIRCYVDGVLTFHLPYALGPLATSTSDLHLGARKGTKFGLKGWLDDVAILAYSIGNPDSRNIARVQGHLSTATTPIPGRKVTINKWHEASGLRIGWSDNFRVKGVAQACRWEIMVDEDTCKSGRLVFDKYTGGNMGSPGVTLNELEPASVFGVCRVEKTGPVTITARIIPVPGYNMGTDCNTGFNHQLYSMEVEEVPWN